MRCIPYLLSAALLLLVCPVQAQDTLDLKLDKVFYNQGDRISWQCTLRTDRASMAASTLHVWIEKTGTGEQWHYRYPLLNYYAEGVLHISDSIPDGRYALNFLLQPDFFNLSGTVLQHRRKDTSINFFLVFRDKETIIGSAAVDPEGHFSLKKYLFRDTALCLFSIPGRKIEDVAVRIQTSLDSLFTPAAVLTRFIRVGLTPDTSKTPGGAAGSYVFDYRSRMKEYLLPELVITGKSIKKLQEYEQEYVSPAFRSTDELVFNGLDEQDIARAPDIYTFLLARVPGLTMNTDASTGTRNLSWRGADINLFLDEFRIEEDMLLQVLPTDVAMIRVLRPGAGTGFTIAVYTRTGAYALPAGNQSRFILHGYDPLQTEWR